MSVSKLLTSSVVMNDVSYCHVLNWNHCITERPGIKKQRHVRRSIVLNVLTLILYQCCMSKDYYDQHSKSTTLTEGDIVTLRSLFSDARPKVSCVSCVRRGIFSSRSTATPQCATTALLFSTGQARMIRVTTQLSLPNKHSYAKGFVRYPFTISCFEKFPILLG